MEADMLVPLILYIAYLVMREDSLILSKRVVGSWV
jgi:hypothetical protein